MKSPIVMQVLYEIAMELGAEADLQKTARKALAAYLHKLGCLAGIIMKANHAAGRLDTLISLPRNLAENCAYREVSARARRETSSKGLNAFINSLPLEGAACGTNYYIMELKDFGVLLLFKSGEAFDRAILHGISRLNQKLAQACLVGLYTSGLETAVRKRTKELQRANKRLRESLANVKTLSGLLPICAGCKKIRDDKGYWNQIETYVRDHSDAEFTHGFCPSCIKKYYPEYSGNNCESGGRKCRGTARPDGNKPPRGKRSGS